MTPFKGTQPIDEEQYKKAVDVVNQCLIDDHLKRLKDRLLIMEPSLTSDILLNMWQSVQHIPRPPKLVMVAPTVPRKKHKFKKWMRESYHKRIQKKWNKRHGFKYPDAIEQGNIIYDKVNNIAFVSAAQYARLARETDYNLSQFPQPSYLGNP